MKIYVTKYFFTAGIQEMEAELPNPERPEMVVVRPVRPGGYDQFFHGKEWHTTREAAVSHAKIMQTRKLAALDKQRQKIAALVIQ